MEATYWYQIWKQSGDDVQPVREGSGKSTSLQDFADFVKASQIDSDELYWTVWNKDTKHYLEFQGSKLIDQG